MNQQTFFDGSAGEKPFHLSRGWKLNAMDNAELPGSKDKVARKAMLAVLRALDSFAGNARSCHPRVSVLMKRSGLTSERHVRRTLRVLESLGLVVVELRNSPRGRVSSRYRIDWERLAPEAFQAARAASKTERAQRTPCPLAPADTVSGPPADILRSPADMVSGPADTVSGPMNRLSNRNTDLYPPPPPPSFEPGSKLEGAGEGIFEGLKGGDLADVPSLLGAFGRLVGRCELRATDDDEEIFLALCFATRREQRAKAGTSEAFRSFLGVLNWRLSRPRIDWRNWITASDRDRAKAERAQAGVRR